MPSAGSASTSSPLACSIGLDRPDPRQVDRLDGGDDTDRRSPRWPRRSAISPPTYIPISRTAASCSGPEAQDRQRQADLVVLVALALERRGTSSPRTAAMASLVEVLAMLPVTPTTSGSNRARQPAARAPRAASGVRDPDDRDVAEGRRVGGTGGVTSSAAAPRADGLGEVARGRRCARPAARRRAARRDQPRVDGGAADRAGRSGRRSRPPVRRTRSSAVRAGRRSEVRGTPRRRHRHRSRPSATACPRFTGRPDAGPTPRCGRVGSVAEQVRAS